MLIDNQIRHIPVIDGRIVGMISIVDVVRAVVGQQTGEMKRLNEFIKGDYYWYTVTETDVIHYLFFYYINLLL